MIATQVMESFIRVYDGKFGEYVKNAKVVLKWEGAFGLNMSNPVFTDSEGTAAITHALTGDASVYVDGQRVGKLQTPGSITVTV